MGRKIALSFACLVLATAFFISQSSAEEGQPKQADNPFAGKIVTVYLKGTAFQAGQVLENAEFKEVGGRTMLVGIGTDTGQKDNWTAGLSVGVAWDEVGTYYLMTKEQFEATRAKKLGL